MPSANEIQTYLVGAWRLMSGKPDGIRLMDVSADGFWNSFFAIVLAVPALVVGWVTIADDFAAAGEGAPGRFATVASLAVVDLGAWVLPLGLLAFAARPLGVADRYVAYVIATNWASALIVWLMLPAALLRLLAPGLGDLASALSLGLFMLSLVLSWRLTNAVIDRGPGIATGVFAIMLALSIAVLLALQSLFGLAEPIPGG